MFKFDLKSAYHHIDILDDHQTFLGFSWVVNGVRKFFAFTVLPFGLSSVPYMFLLDFGELTQLGSRFTLMTILVPLAFLLAVRLHPSL